MRRTMIVVLGAALLATAVTPALAAPEGPEKFYKKAVLSEKEGRLEEAIEGYRLVIREWPDDKEFTPVAHLKVASCLARLGKIEPALDWCREVIEKYEGWEKLQAQAKKFQAEIKAHAAMLAQKKKKEKVLDEKLEAIERHLKEKGLRGEELERAFQQEKQKLLDAWRREKEHAAKERLDEALKEGGVPPEEVERRYREAKAHEAELREAVEEARRLLEKSQATKAEMDRRLAELRERLGQQEEDRWRERRGEDVEAARREFIELAERLGIPGEEAARFLEEHLRRDHPRPEERDLGREIDDLHRKLDGLVEKINEAFRHVGERLEKLERELRERK